MRAIVRRIVDAGFLMSAYDKIHIAIAPPDVPELELI
jgi:hypothetical protein